jgi:hypothetical protein
LDDASSALLEEIGTLGRQFRDNHVDIDRTGAAPLRWRNVLMVMLEKKIGCALVGKLRAILLKEADDNFHSGVMFGGRMMDRAQEIGFIPEEQMAERQCTVEDCVFQKIRMHDYARLRRSAYSVVSADAANCYDRVNHIILALLLWALGMPHGPIAAMLLTIASMKYYLRTGFGESKDYINFFARRVTHTTQVTLFYPVEICKGISTENISLPYLHVHHHHFGYLPLIITSALCLPSDLPTSNYYPRFSTQFDTQFVFTRLETPKK